MARTISVEILGDASSLERAFKKSSSAGKKFQGDTAKTQSKTKSAFGGMRRSVLGLAGGFVGAAGLISVAKTAFSEMADAQKVTAQTNAVLKSTGKIAGVSAKHVDDLSSQLMTLSGTDDEVIKSGENMLLTFTNIRNGVGKGDKVFDQATKTLLDMSTATGTDMSKSAIQLGKALNDPIKGVGSLARVGVTFTEEQKKQIKALVESGHVMDAQKIILRELNKEFGGSAAAAGRTLPGKLNILKQTLLNLGGSIAQTLSPAITQLVDKITTWLSKSKNQKTILDTVKAAAQAVSSAVKVLTAAFQTLNGITGSTKNTFKLLLAAFIAFKALKLVSYIAGMTKQMRLFGAASATAGPGGAGGAGKFGKAVGAIGAVAVGAPLVAAGLRKIPGWDKTFRGLGGRLAGGGGDRGFRAESMRMHQRAIVIHNMHTGAPNAKALREDILRHAKQRAPQRRGAR